jgi:hypothetical protein
LVGLQQEVLFEIFHLLCAKRTGMAVACLIEVNRAESLSYLCPK